MKPQKIQEIRSAVTEILNHVEKHEDEHQSLIKMVDKSHQKSAINLMHYLALRSFDIRKLQKRLGNLGMSRLARSEAHVEASLKTTLFFLNHLLGVDSAPNDDYDMSIKQSEKALKKNTKNLLGNTPDKRRLRVMVTIPDKAVKRYELVEEMVASGMNCARINCAHDTPEDWLKMINHIKKASEKLEKEVVITMDVGGPKIRTGEIKGHKGVKHFKPNRNDLGQVVEPAVIKLVSSEKIELGSDELPVNLEWLEKLNVGDEISFKDTRGKSRITKVIEVEENTVITHSDDSAYIETDTQLTAPHGKVKVEELPPVDQVIFLKNDDYLKLYKTSIKGEPAKFDGEGNVVSPAKLSCTLPAALEGIKKGDPIYFDDGEITGEVEAIEYDHFLIRIVKAKSGGTKLKSDKGINLPDSNVQISGLTSKDKEDLKFIAEHADIVNFSFVQTPEDVKDMISELEKLGVKDKLGVILKIETQKGYDNLSKILMEAMKLKKIGVMIARGDLAIETGWERIGSIQKEMLAICNAAHIPVVWATQVLENLAKKGLPSRSEITDVVNAAKAECVMLNKGPHIIEAIKLLDTIIISSEMFQDKNAPVLPKLKRIMKKS